MQGVGQRHFSEETEAYPGNAGSGTDHVFRRKQRRIQVILGRGRVYTFSEEAEAYPGECWEWGSHFTEETEAYPGNAGSGAEWDIFRRKQRRIQVMLEGGRVTFRRKQRRRQCWSGAGDAGSGADTFLGGNRGVCWEVILGRG